MCGRYHLEIDDKLIELLPPELLYQIISGDVVPGQMCLILDNNRKPVVKKWQYKFNKRNLINSRIETIASHPNYQSDFNNHKCLVLANGFYENSDDGKRHYIHLKDKYIYLAAIYNETGFSIITKPATKTSSIHDRCPIVFTRNQIDDFIQNKLSFNQLLTNNPDFIIDSNFENLTLF